MIGAHLLESQPVVDILEHFLQELYQLASLDVVARLLSWILDSAVLPSGMYLLLQWNCLAGQPVGSHTKSGQVESLQLTDSAGQGSQDWYFRVN
jgi:hypothetical protein